MSERDGKGSIRPNSNNTRTGTSSSSCKKDHADVTATRSRARRVQFAPPETPAMPDVVHRFPLCTQQYETSAAQGWHASSHLQDTHRCCAQQYAPRSYHAHDLLGPPRRVVADQPRLPAVLEEDPFRSLFPGQSNLLLDPTDRGPASRGEGARETSEDRTTTRMSAKNVVTRVVITPTGNDLHRRRHSMKGSRPPGRSAARLCCPCPGGSGGRSFTRGILPTKLRNKRRAAVLAADTRRDILGGTRNKTSARNRAPGWVNQNSCPASSRHQRAHTAGMCSFIFIPGTNHVGIGAHGSRDSVS